VPKATPHGCPATEKPRQSLQTAPVRCKAKCPLDIWAEIQDLVPVKGVEVQVLSSALQNPDWRRVSGGQSIFLLPHQNVWASELRLRY